MILLMDAKRTRPELRGSPRQTKESWKPEYKTFSRRPSIGIYWPFRALLRMREGPLEGPGEGASKVRARGRIGPLSRATAHAAQTGGQRVTDFPAPRLLVAPHGPKERRRVHAREHLSHGKDPLADRANTPYLCPPNHA